MLPSFPEQYLEDECTAGPWKELLLAVGKYFYIVLHKGTNLTSSNDLTCSQWSYGDIAPRAKFLCCFKFQFIYIYFILCEHIVSSGQILTLF